MPSAMAKPYSSIQFESWARADVLLTPAATRLATVHMAFSPRLDIIGNISQILAAFQTRRQMLFSANVAAKNLKRPSIRIGLQVRSREKLGLGPIGSVRMDFAESGAVRAAGYGAIFEATFRFAFSQARTRTRAESKSFS